MAVKTIQIKSVFQGISPTQYFGAEGTYNSGMSVDPDLPILPSDIRTSGLPVPVSYTNFSSSNVTSQVIRIITNPKNTNIYVVLSNGRLISYTSTHASETLIGTVSGGVATWAEYYNNYIYIWTGTDISRYGPLNNSPSLVDSVWTGATLGSLTALTNTTYPSLRNVTIPNHVAHVHGDSSMYFCDFINGQGKIHRINTKKVTDEGDTNGTTVPSAYGALTLPFGFYPTAIESYASKDLMILGMYTTDTTIIQGKSAFILWDPTNTVSFYLGPVFLADPIATALLNVNGVIHIFSGNTSGMRVARYLGAETVRDIVYLEEGTPPFAGAVDALGNRVVWGTYSTNPATGAVVYALGSKDARLPSGLHNIVKTSSAGSSPVVTALKYTQQASNAFPRLDVAWKDGTTQKIDQVTNNGTLASIIRFMINIGQMFDIRSIRIPLAGAVDSNTTITPTVYLDDLSSSTVLPVINNTNYPSKRKVMYNGTDLKNTTARNNIVLEFAWTGTTPLPIGLPIKIEIDVKEDEP